MAVNLKDLQKLYLDALENYKTEIDRDGDVVFLHPELGQFYISLDAEKDPEFFRLVFPNFADDKQLELKKGDLLDLANEVNIKNKAVKLTVKHLASDDSWNVSAQVEAFIAGPNEMPRADLVQATLSRYISAIRAGLGAFIQGAKERSSLKGGDDEI